MPTDSDPMAESNPSSPATSTPTSFSSSSHETEDTQSTTSESSIASTISDRQLLTRLCRKPQIRIFDNISIPLPATNTESEDSSEDEEINDTNLEKTDTI